MGELRIKERNKVNHGGRKARAKGLVPGVLYGKNINNFMFEISSLELDREVCNVGEHGILNVEFNGDSKQVLIKEVQREPVNHEIIHIDLEMIAKGEKIETEVPIQYIGEKLLTKKGAVLQKEKDSVKVSCDSASLPKSVKLDVSRGINGSVYRLDDIEVASEISILEDLNSVVASISNEKKLVAELVEQELSPVQKITKDKYTKNN
ncbi:50S ribosomal protein L25/general stress protein Ctc [Clostridium baratii]|uniref:50S ribosomal protein L25 n=1 Tax=Clostridium baratii TaxID=1561 RepID=UPI0009A2CC19|nr:50S ribosomal protein L25 [Clostridium baratii]OPF51802.1 50S ribosomal protein L25/general stress protein Ctc [Clostridium baratii]OPF53447.1 50S ribosomal protein L25/general stress protein Ctc [Clostridium baratii]OPF57408.1 50S ribosomal protein L25/general stress protein Ctc [Clostridium baratii]OPF60494.1 50S ribosomal protein L25/general stress protein Ctc [Clostridium baratii]